MGHQHALVGGPKLPEPALSFGLGTSLESSLWSDRYTVDLEDQR